MRLNRSLFSTVALRGITANEHRLGRLIRDGEGHADASAAAHGAPVPPIERAEGAPPAVEDTSAPDVQDFADFERELNNPTPAAPADEKPASGDVDPATAKPDDENTAPPDGEAPGASAQQRIDEITEKWRNEERRAAAAEARLEESRRGQQPPKKDEAPAGTSAEEDQAPDPTKYEFGEADAKFIADHSRWHARQEFRQEYQRAEQERAVRTEIEQVEAGWSAAVAKPEVAERYPDFAEKVTEGAKTAAWKCSPLMAIAIKASEVGPDVAYHLATNPAESERIARLGNVEQAMEIGRLEGRYLARSNTATPATPPKLATGAPPPPPRTRGAGGQFAPSADTEDFSQFDKMADGILDGAKPY